MKQNQNTMTKSNQMSHALDQEWGISNEILIDLTVILWFCNAPLKSIVHIPLGMLGMGGLTIAVAGFVTFIPLFLYLLLERRLPCKRFLSLYVIVALLFAITLSMHPEYEYWYGREIYGIAYTVFRPDHGALWAVLMVELCGSYKRLFKNLSVAAVVIFFHNIYLAYSATAVGYWTYFSESGVVAQRSYDLDFGYNMAFVAIVAMVHAIRKRNKALWAVAFICIMLDLRFGSRGSLLCIVAMSVFWLMSSRASLRKKVILLAFIIPLVAVIAIYGEAILFGLADFLSGTLGLESRTITSFLQGDLLNDNGRDGIYQIAQAAIEANPYGYGAYADRAIIGPHYYWGYSHNIYYEMALNFGVVGAVCLLVLIAAAFLICLIRTKDQDCRAAVIVCASMCMRLLVSDTFWGNIYFWMLIGILLTYYFRLHPKNDNLKRGRTR